MLKTTFTYRDDKEKACPLSRVNFTRFNKSNGLVRPFE